MPRLIALVATMFMFSASAASSGVFTEESKTWTAAESDAAGARGSILSMDATETTTGWFVSMTLDTSLYTGTSSHPGFNQIGAGIIKDWSSATLSSVKDPNSTSIFGDWGSVASGSVNSGASGPCDADTGHFKFCVSGYSDISAQKGEYVWTFELTGGTLMDVDDWHWGGQYSDLQYEPFGVRQKGWIISTEDTVIPEPSAALVFALGFGVISAARRKN